MTTVLLIFAGLFAFMSSIVVDCIVNPKATDTTGFTIINFLGLFVIALLVVFGVISVTTTFIIYGVSCVISLLRILNFKKVIQFIGKIGP